MPRTTLPATASRGIDTFGLLALLGGALAMGVSPIFVRFAAADGVPAFASAFWRVALAIPVLYGWALAEERQAGTGPKASMNKAIFVAGLFFAGDLLCWHLAILNTSVANATFFGTTTPIWVVLTAWLVYRETIPRAVPVGLLLCLLGGAALIGRSLELDVTHVKGDLFGLATAIFFSLYFFAVQEARKGSGAARSTFGLSLVTAPILAAAALLNGEIFLPNSATGYAALFAMAFISHAGGQGLLAIALGRLPAVFTSFVIFIEAVAAALLAWLVLGEPLVALQFLGGILILLGIYIARPRAKMTPSSN
jgi:hypothetical protein